MASGKFIRNEVLYRGAGLRACRTIQLHMGDQLIANYFSAVLKILYFSPVTFLLNRNYVRAEHGVGPYLWSAEPKLA
jgi:hypothetical protein